MVDALVVSAYPDLLEIVQLLSCLMTRHYFTLPPGGSDALAAREGHDFGIRLTSVADRNKPSPSLRLDSPRGRVKRTANYGTSQEAARPLGIGLSAFFESPQHLRPNRGLIVTIERMKCSPCGILLLLAAGTAHAGDASPSSVVSPEQVAAAVEKAHAVLWSKFIGDDGLIHDYVGELPTPKDCEEGRPNAIGWWSPIENGPMFTGSYLVAICERVRRSGAAADREKARRLAKGLLKCASVSDVPGFIARGMGTDGKCHYPMGSQDQTHPWFYGLHAYATSGIPNAKEQKVVVDKMKEVAEALERADWKCPCDGAFKGQSRGDFKLFRHHGAVMYLFILRAMHDVTGDRVWLEHYQKAMTERSEKTGKTRLEICAEGYPYDREQIKNIDRALLWIYVSSQGALARLADWETDEDIRSQYRAGLAINARGALAVIDAYKTFDNDDTKVFGHARWREGYPAWFSQKTQADAEKMASTRDRKVLGERKSYEASRMRHPLAAAALIAMAGYQDGFESVRKAICHYDYTKLNMAELFFAECAYYALPVDFDRP